jgi:hypothetical protein
MALQHPYLVSMKVSVFKVDLKEKRGLWIRHRRGERRFQRLKDRARKFLGAYRASPKHASIAFFDLREAANTVIEF